MLSIMVWVPIGDDCSGQAPRRNLLGMTMLAKHSVGTYHENELTCNLSGNDCPQSPQLAEPLWTDPGQKNGIGACELISTFYRVQVGNDSLNLSPKS